MSEPVFDPIIAEPQFGFGLAVWESYTQMDTAVVLETVRAVGFEAVMASCLDVIVLMFCTLMDNSNEVHSRLDFIIETVPMVDGEVSPNMAGVHTFITGLRASLGANWEGIFLDFATIDTAVTLEIQIDQSGLDGWQCIDAIVNTMRLIALNTNSLRDLDEVQQIDMLRNVNLQHLF